MTIKNIILSLIFSLIFTATFGQSKGTLNYKYIQNTPYGPNVINFITYFQGNKSLEVGIYNTKSTLDSLNENEFIKNISFSSNKRPFVFKDLSNNTLLLADNILTKLFFIRDTLNNFKWKATNENKQILGYKCTKASLNYRGRDFIAWYTDAIPLQFGPWKFGGLPGLIIKLNDTQNNFVYELTGIDFKSDFDSNIIKVPSAFLKDQPISHKDFIAIMNKKNLDYIKMNKIVTVGADGSTVSGNSVIAEKIEKF